jgi:hypothetical protein
VYFPGDRVKSQAMTGVGAPAGKVRPDAHRSPWGRIWPSVIDEIVREGARFERGKLIEREHQDAA